MTRHPITRDAERNDDRTVVDPVAPMRSWRTQADASSADPEATVIVERQATVLGSRFELPAGGGASSKGLSSLYALLGRRRTAVIGVTAFLLMCAIVMVAWLRTGQRTKAQEVERLAAAIREQQEERQQEIAERVRERALLREREAARIEASLGAFVGERRERLAAVRLRETILSEIRGRPPRKNAVSDAVARERSELEKAGADLLAANNHRGALDLYRKLAAIFPEEPSFVDLVTILENSDRCEEGVKCR